MNYKTGCVKLNRRRFIKQSAFTAGSLLASMCALTDGAVAAQQLVLLHANDVHSQLEPFPMVGSCNQGWGGFAARALHTKEIRATYEHILLLDAGDIFQGTPYFNMHKGEPGIQARTRMGYDACAMGNHDLDTGLENFATQLQHATFPVIMCNYDFPELLWKANQCLLKVSEKAS